VHSRYNSGNRGSYKNRLVNRLSGLRNNSFNMRLFLTGVLLALFFFSSAVRADVIWDRGPDKGVLARGTDSLFELVSSSARPGGTRTVELNGQNMVVLRLVKPGGDDGEYSKLWHAVAEQQDKMIDYERLEELLTPKKTLQLLTKQSPFKTIITQASLLKKTIDEEAEKIEANGRALVIERLEQVSAYETHNWRGMAKIPVSAIDPSSPLATAPPTDGFIIIAEKNTDSQVSDSFWMFRFGEDFNILDALGGEREGAEDDAQANSADKESSFPLDLYPDSKVVMSFSEETKGWESDLWSVESRGDVLSHVAHYIASFESAGYEATNVRSAQSDYALMQFRKPGIESTLFVDLINPLTHEVQVTLQNKYPR